MDKPMTIKEGFKKGAIPDTGSEIQEMLYKIAVERAETVDDFIFTTFQGYLGKMFPTEMSCIPKRLLVRALDCFQKEHAEEYAVLMKESYTRCVKGGNVDGTD